MATNLEKKQAQDKAVGATKLNDDALDNVVGGISDRGVTIRGTGVSMLMGDDEKGPAINLCSCGNPLTYQGIAGGKRMFICSKCTKIVYYN